MAPMALLAFGLVPLTQQGGNRVVPQKTKHSTLGSWGGLGLDLLGKLSPARNFHCGKRGTGEISLFML